VVTVGCISFAFLEGSCSAMVLVQIMAGAGETEWYVVSLGGEWREQGRWFCPGGSEIWGPAIKSSLHLPIAVCPWVSHLATLFPSVKGDNPNANLIGLL